MIKLVLIEDDKDLNELLALRFRTLGYEVFVFYECVDISLTLKMTMI